MGFSMLAKLEQNAALLTGGDLGKTRHAFIVLPKMSSAGGLRGIPGAEALSAALSRRRKKIADLAKAPVAADIGQGTLASWVMLDPAQPVFEQQTLLRKGLQALLAEKPETITIGVFGPAARRRHAAELAVYTAWVNGARLPERKKTESAAVQTLSLNGYRAPDGFARQRAVAQGNLLCRELTALPPNELNPGTYRKRVRDLARQQGWRHEEYDVKRLRKMGAGAFVAVAQGSAEADAAIVHLAYHPPRAKKTIAVIGKGICYDTGGHNLKPARHMQGMHKDMNGSAVALGILLAASGMKLPVRIDCWMAIARNDIGPRAYHQDEIMTALNGTTIEIVHTDAEGRMVLADTLALAARGKPDLMLDFATLTGSKHAALAARWRRARSPASGCARFPWTRTTTRPWKARSRT
jgi:leucyl aminopeptidase